MSTSTSIAAAAREEISDFEGRPIGPEDADYDQARKVYNAMIDKRPALIARCASPDDVAKTVAFARKHELLVAVRGGGHNGAGLGTCDDGVVIDLSPLKDVEVDPQARTVRVGGGCTWGEVDRATNEHGLATPSGIISTTGVGGLTLGGGIGYLNRRYGLSIDNLLSADVVTADGRLVIASTDENPDLFWAIRGGGGNFGVVTSFEFRLHPVSTVYGGPIFYPVDADKQVMQFYREFIAAAPRELSAFFGYHIAPPAPFVPEHLHGHTACALVVCYTGPLEQAEVAVKPIREAAPIALDLMGPLPYPALNSLFDALLPPGLQHYWKADVDNELSDAAIAVHAEYGPQVPNFLSLMHLYPLDGAVQDVDRAATAFGGRDARFSHIIAGIDTEPANMPAHREWVRDYWAALHPLSAGASYVNFLMDEGQERVKATYQELYPRLQAVKDEYDPTNLFHMNQNVRPRV
jgi:FAD/FMN-containing dehydrogenase